MEDIANVGEDTDWTGTEEPAEEFHILVVQEEEEDANIFAGGGEEDINVHVGAGSRYRGTGDLALENIHVTQEEKEDASISAGKEEEEEDTFVHVKEDGSLLVIEEDA